jgi:hypothetical protein
MRVHSEPVGRSTIQMCDLERDPRTGNGPERGPFLHVRAVVPTGFEPVSPP